MIKTAQIEIDNIVNRYKGKKVSELKQMLNVPEKNNKASFVVLARKILNITSNQFMLCDGKVEAVLKTIRLTGTDKPAEAMSFMPVNFSEWTSVSSWEESSLRKYFINKYLVFFIFQQYPSGKRVEDEEMTFLGVKVWRMPEYDINHGLKDVWQEVRNLILNNELVITPYERKDGVIINKNNLPSSSFNELGHLRPGGKNGMDTIELETGQNIVKQRFWFNSNYVEEIIKS